MTNPILRVGPVAFPGPVRTETKNGFEVVQEYQDQGEGPWLVDLSHVAKWDLQDREISSVRVWGLTPPDRPGEGLLDEGRLLSRLNRTQVAAWDLSGRAGRIDEPCATETTDGLCLLALVGKDLAAVVERITPLDVFAPRLTTPALIQGPVLHVPCQIVRLGHDGGLGTLLVAFSRGYGRSMAEGILGAAEDLGLRPGGEEIFSRQLTG